MNRKKVYWKFRDRSVELGPRTLLVAVLNVTPDSFSDGDRYAEPEAAAARAMEMQEQGADILDIGAESTRPGSERVSEAEELRRLIPVLKKLKGRIDIPISVDTYKPGVAELAIEHGAHIINDVSGLTWEPDLLKVVLRHGAGLVLNHMRGTPQTWAKLPPMRDVMGEIFSELQASLHRATRAGVPTDHIVVDPGIGFGKRKEQNSELIARLEELTRLHVPVLAGPSRKSFLDQDSPDRTEFATAAAVAASILNGASLIRVHDVPSMAAVMRVIDAIVAGVPEREEAPVTRVARRDEEGQMREMVFGEEPPRRPVRPPAIKRPSAEISDPQRLPLFQKAEDAPEIMAPEPPEVEPEVLDAQPEPLEKEESVDRPAAPPPRTGEKAQPEWWGSGNRHPRSGGGDRPSYGRGNRPAAGGGDRPPSRGRADRPPRSGGGDRPSYGRGNRPEAGGGDRPPRRGPADRPPRSSSGGRPSYGRGNRPEAGGGDRPPGRGPADRPPRGGGGDRPSYGRGERPAAGRRDRPPGRGPADRPPPRGDRPPSGRGDGPAPRGGDRPAGDGPADAPPPRSDRPSYGRGDRPAPGGGDRPPGRGPSNWPPRSGVGNRPSYGRGAAKKTPFRPGQRTSGPRPPRGDDDRGGPASGGRPPRTPRGGASSGPPRKRSGPPGGGGRRGPNTPPPRRKG